MNTKFEKNEKTTYTKALEYKSKSQRQYIDHKRSSTESIKEAFTRQYIENKDIKNSRERFYKQRNKLISNINSILKMDDNDEIFLNSEKKINCKRNSIKSRKDLMQMYSKKLTDEFRYINNNSNDEIKKQNNNLAEQKNNVHVRKVSCGPYLLN